MTVVFAIASDAVMPETAFCHSQPHEKDVIITVRSTCPRTAFSLCSGMEMALEYGAVPAAQAYAIEAVNKANRMGQPVACTLEFFF